MGSGFGEFAKPCGISYHFAGVYGVILFWRYSQNRIYRFSYLIRLSPFADNLPILRVFMGSIAFGEFAKSVTPP